jgi:hypothetical protein
MRSLLIVYVQGDPILELAKKQLELQERSQASQLAASQAKQQTMDRLATLLGNVIERLLPVAQPADRPGAGPSAL